MSASGREPNQLATTLLLHEGLEAVSQNRWPSLAFDVRPRSTASRPVSARGLLLQDLHVAGLGVGASLRATHPPRGGTRACSRRSSARTPIPRKRCTSIPMCSSSVPEPRGSPPQQSFGASGLRVLLAEQDAALGGGTLLDARWQAWRERRRAGLVRVPGVRCLERTTVLGAYGHGVFAALEILGAAESCRVRRAARAAACDPDATRAPGHGSERAADRLCTVTTSRE